MHNYARYAVIGLFIAGPLATTAPLAQEDDDFDAIIKYRQGVMKAQGGTMAALSQLIRGKVREDGDRITRLAHVLTITTDGIPAMFPEGSDFGETDAKEAIWEKWERFEKLAKSARSRATELLEAAGSGDAKETAAAFRKMADACKACHKDFRQEAE